MFCADSAVKPDCSAVADFLRQKQEQGLLEQEVPAGRGPAWDEEKGHEAGLQG